MLRRFFKLIHEKGQFYLVNFLFIDFDSNILASIKWTSIHLPESCKSSSDCDYKFQYQYDQNQG